MKGRQSRYVTGGESFAEIARRPAGTVVILSLNTDLEDALREVSKSLKSAFCRSGRKCRLSAGTIEGPAGRGHPSVCIGTLRIRGYKKQICICPDEEENKCASKRRIALFAKNYLAISCYSDICGQSRVYNCQVR